jgi:hypothetical protein
MRAYGSWIQFSDDKLIHKEDDAYSGDYGVSF